MTVWRHATGLIFAALLFSALPLHAQTSANVPLLDPAYQWIDTLIGAGLVTSAFPEQRPWSRLEFARLIHEADHEFSDAHKKVPSDVSYIKFSKIMSQRQFLNKILQALHHEFHSELSDPSKKTAIVPIEAAHVKNTALGQNPEPVPNMGVGNTTGIFHPLVDNEEGRNFIKGNGFDLQTQHSVQLGKYFTAFARPEIEITTATSGSTSVNIYAKSLAVKTGWKNIELEVGRDQVVWGYAPHGGVLFSDNPRGLDLVQLSTPHPFHLPSALKKLGTFEFTTLFSYMGPQFLPDKSWISATQINWHFTPNMGIGAGHQLTFAGVGNSIPAPQYMFFEFLGYPTKAGNAHQGGSEINRGYFGTFFIRFPKLRNIELSGQIYFEDKSFTSAELLLRHEIAYFACLKIPRLSYDGRYSLYMEYRYTGSRAYTHSEYRSGWTLNNNFIALTDGPDTQSLRTTLAYTISPYSKLQWDSAYIRRLNNTYTMTGPTPDEPTGITTLSSGPTEHHILNVLQAKIGLSDHLTLFARGGVDWIQNANFTQGQTAHPGVFQLGLVWQK